MYADALRAVTLVSRLIGPGLPLVLMGQSQGAALSLVAAGLTGQAVAVAADVPFLCSIREALELTTAFPYRELSAYLRDRPDEAEEALRTVGIFDVLGFAPPGHLSGTHEHRYPRPRDAIGGDASACSRLASRGGD